MRLNHSGAVKQNKVTWTCPVEATTTNEEDIDGVIPEILRQLSHAPMTMVTTSTWSADERW